MDDINIRQDEDDIIIGFDQADGDTDIVVEDDTIDISDIEFIQDDTEDIEFVEDSEELEVLYEVDEVVPVMVTTHDKLTHREYPDQHPIKSVSYLTDELSIRPTSVISDAEIMAL